MHIVVSRPTENSFAIHPLSNVGLKCCVHFVFIKSVLQFRVISYLKMIPNYETPYN